MQVELKRPCLCERILTKCTCRKSFNCSILALFCCCQESTAISTQLTSGSHDKIEKISGCASSPLANLCPCFSTQGAGIAPVQLKLQICQICSQPKRCCIAFRVFQQHTCMQSHIIFLPAVPWRIQCTIPMKKARQ